MWKIVMLAMLSICPGCIADQESVRTLVAIELPPTSAADRRDLLVILRRNAKADGDLHVDDGSEVWRKFQRDSNLPADSRATIRLGVWRGKDDDHFEASIDDMGHLGRVWIMFLKGIQPDRTAKFRLAVLAEIKHRWPNTKSIPVLPSGGVPLVQDLRLTPTGYKIEPAAASSYDLPPTSPLIAGVNDRAN